MIKKKQNDFVLSSNEFCGGRGWGKSVKTSIGRCKTFFFFVKLSESFKINEKSDKIRSHVVKRIRRQLVHPVYIYIQQLMAIRSDLLYANAYYTHVRRLRQYYNTSRYLRHVIIEIVFFSPRFFFFFPLKTRHAIELFIPLIIITCTRTNGRRPITRVMRTRISSATI